jgi:signal transduction histidine kinase
MPAGRGLRERDLALLRDLADQTVVAFRNARLAAELSSELAQLAVGTDRLAESRRRLISAGDAERDRLERAIARDVVPHLRSLPDRLEELAARGPQDLDGAALQPLLADTAAALEALREITRGVYPAQLVRSGLESALRSLLSRTGTASLTVDALPSRDRIGPQVEGAAYFCVAEAARDLAEVSAVTLTAVDGHLVVRVAGRGRLDRLSLANVRDRTEAVGGELHEVVERDDVVLEARLPLPPGDRAATQPVAAAHAAVSRSGSSSDLVT